MTRFQEWLDEPETVDALAKLALGGMHSISLRLLLANAYYAGADRALEMMVVPRKEAS